jgi:transposase-like protein
LVISDSHLGLKQAVAQVSVGATWQRCRVHFMRNAMATVPKVAQQIVAATLRTVFAQPDQASAHESIERICRLFEKRYPQLVKVLQEAEVDVLYVTAARLASITCCYHPHKSRRNLLEAFKAT